jgi:hypothetical protein
VPAKSTTTKKKTAAKKTSAPRNANSTSGKFTAEERAAMKEYARELKEQKTKEDGKKLLKEAIAKMKEPDRTMAKRIDALVMEAAPDLAQRTWYGMPAYAKDDRWSASSRTRRSSRRATRRSGSATRPASTRAACGRPRSR